MKNVKLLRYTLAGLVTISVLSCSNNDDDDASNNVTPVNVQELRDISTNGTWRITSYVEEGDNETHHFTNYTFTFDDDGTVTAVNGETTIAGTWSVTDGEDDDDSPSNADFVLDFNVDEDSDFDDLDDDWDIENYSSTKISLIDISGGNGGTDKLVFEKN